MLDSYQNLNNSEIFILQRLFKDRSDVEKCIHLIKILQKLNTTEVESLLEEFEKRQLPTSAPLWGPDSIYMRRLRAELVGYFNNIGKIVLTENFSLEISIESIEYKSLYRDSHISVSFEQKLLYKDKEVLCYALVKPFEPQKTVYIKNVVEESTSCIKDELTSNSNVEHLLSTLHSRFAKQDVVHMLNELKCIFIAPAQKNFLGQILEYLLIDMKKAVRTSGVTQKMIDNLATYECLIADWIHREKDGVIISRSKYMLILEKDGNRYVKKGKDSGIYRRYLLLQKLKGEK